MMAKYRQLYTEFWSDSFVLELTPEEKYFYVYLLSNSKTTQSGIYEISKRIIETETGYSRETVEKLLKRFCDYNKILYCENTKELMVINWIRYNVPNNINAIKCINKELSRVKNKEFIKILFKKCLIAELDVEKIFANLMVSETYNNSSVDCSLGKVDKFPSKATIEESTEVIFKEAEKVLEKEEHDYVEKQETEKFSANLDNKLLPRDLQGPYKGLPSNKEEVINRKEKVRSKEEEVYEEMLQAEAMRNKSDSSATKGERLENIIKSFEENVHAITPLEYEKISEFTELVSYEVILLAIEEAVNYNVKTMKYITNILNNWISNGIKTPEEVRAYQKEWANKKDKNLKHHVKKGSFCDYEQRSYDFDALEKKLLGLSDSEDLY